ncbi:MAG: 50S ribosomal protein L15 [Anaerolineales bacterium]|nr:50S ribosomal protein L15 [Anaerolineales bacterium]
MKLHDLKPRDGSKKSRKRVGRGIAAGQGKTAGRGTKGQKSRSGSGGKLYHQGGNLPFYRRLPFKRGFTNRNRIEWTEVNLERLEAFSADSEITPEALIEAGIVKNLQKPIVLLGQGEVKVPLNVRLHRVTRNAKSAIEAAGGTVEVLKV